MLKRIWNALLSLFRKRKPPQAPPDTWESGTGYSRHAEAAPDESADEYPFVSTDDDRRVALLTSRLKPYRRRRPEVRKMEVEDFTEAYRFWQRMCGPRGFTYRCSGGHFRYRTTMHGATGTMELTDKTGRDSVVAVLRIGGIVPGGQVKEIKFIVSNHKNRLKR